MSIPPLDFADTTTDIRLQLFGQMLNAVATATDVRDLHGALIGIMRRAFGVHCYVEVTTQGHNPPLLRRAADGAITELSGASGLPLGLFPQQTYDQCRLRLSPGDLVLLFSDGIVEAENPSGQPFDLDQLRKAFASVANGNAREILTAIRSAVQSHEKNTRPKDDQTLFVLRVI